MSKLDGIEEGRSVNAGQDWIPLSSCMGRDVMSWFRPLDQLQKVENDTRRISSNHATTFKT